MTSSSETLMLIASDENATLCTDSNGVVRLLRRIDRVLPAINKCGDSESALDTRTFFACELMMALWRCLRECAYDGVVIFADGPMMEDLRQVKISAISRVLIAEIVGKPSEVIHLLGRCDADAPVITKDTITGAIFRRSQGDRSVPRGRY